MNMKQLKIVMGLALLVLVYAEPSFAQGKDMKDVLCATYDFATDGVGQAIATIAILALGFMALLGRVQWMLVIMVAAGIAVIFSAPKIVATISEGEACGQSGGGSGSGGIGGR